MKRIVFHCILDLLRSRVLLSYTAITLVMGFTLFSVQSYDQKALLSLLSFMLIAVPLMSLIFATTYLYNSDEFMLILAAQPLKRGVILQGSLLALGLSLGLATAVGVGIPILVSAPTLQGLVITGVGVVLTWVFVALSGFAYVMSRDKAKGIGFAILLWIFFALLFDGIVLSLFFALSEYPLESLMLVLSACNPIDLARLLAILQLETSALMGFSAAVFRQFLGSTMGYGVAVVALALWIIVPSVLALRIFRSRDL